MTERPALRPRAGSAATVVFLSGLAASAIVTLPFFGQTAKAQTAESRRDQPTPATLPDPAVTRQREGDRPMPQVAPPEAITSSTAIMPSDRRGKASYTNPLDHLPARDRVAAGGSRRD